jgi:hypothetical protein
MRGTRGLQHALCLRAFVVQSQECFNAESRRALRIAEERNCTRSRRFRVVSGSASSADAFLARAEPALGAPRPRESPWARQKNRTKRGSHQHVGDLEHEIADLAAVFRRALVVDEALAIYMVNIDLMKNLGRASRVRKGGRAFQPAGQQRRPAWPPSLFAPATAPATRPANLENWIPNQPAGGFHPPAIL